ncbi:MULTISPECIES: coenzyme F420 hydrogenase subunit beta [Methanosphaera]|jgi:coenzyme F420 hydrogenase subunit beta|uniref:Coenzyme F420 hydrogenase subunit beta n=2 Tax=Methanosphaera stadtmanae TaxID=2317 RepID=Q2NES1_METST|nr:MULTISPECIES: coenzyme F420 hydrogenase subunit beta [Methanosphaera]ABC57682.1 FrhB [Methanosphaera stadtmanae DSM 3091]MDO5821470.1 coenzyme F420 hydrogenase subunit beta [Methanosphaera sp.]MEE0489000.1 coenzyme F420 hydrogenase subunit beta [Methanosphaera stadtmanae]OEC92134.1 coenzyme F420 hydrogenase subunit beta [Methanosphaera sp. A6]RAP02604.1 coenzyme F420 hydrogenase subunit beta [Methanosphaera stadtmanae]
MIQDSVLGPHQEIITAKAADNKVLSKAQDGGIVSAILIYALEENIIDGTIVAGPGDEPWKPEPLVATTKKEILKGAGTKYTMCPNLSVIKEATREYGLEKIGTVGTPCQVMGLRKMQTYPLGVRNVVDKIALSIGIYCMENFPYESLKTFINDKVGVTPSQVTKMNITKGKLFITHTGGEGKIPLKETHGYEQAGCNYCMDYVAELSDLSCGSVGAKPGWSTIIKRTDKGASLIDKAIKEGVLETTETNEGKFGLEMLRKLSTNKKKKHQKRIDKQIDYGLNMPFTHSKDKNDPLENR